MNLSTVLRAVTRRWYLSVPGVLLSVALALFAHQNVHPTYTRTATMLMIPDQSSIPKGSNPYLYIGGLTQAADVLVRAASAQSAVAAIEASYPGASVSITRDTSTSSPVIDISVSTKDAAQTGPVVQRSLADVTDTLKQLQASEHLSAQQQITVSTLSVDTKATPKTKTQLMATVGAGAVFLLLTLAVTSFVDGRMLAARQRAKRVRVTRRKAIASSNAEVADAA